MATLTENTTMQSLSTSQIKSIQLADGWHSVENCKLVPNFEITNSPATGQGYPYLSYTSQGKQVFTSLRNVISVSSNQRSGSSEFNSNTGNQPQR